VKWQKLFVKFAQTFAGNAMKNAANIKLIIARNVQEYVNFVQRNVRNFGKVNLAIFRQTLPKFSIQAN
jgi:hypothetical protein